MKRYIGIICLLLVLTLSICGCNSDNGVINNGGGDIQVNSSEVSEKNTIVGVPIILKSNPGFLIGNIVIDYDTDNFLFVEGISSKMFTQCSVTEDAGRIMCMVQTAPTDLKDVTETGTVVTLNFKLKENAKKGTYPITVSSSSQFANSEEKWVTCEFEESKITIN